MSIKKILLLLLTLIISFALFSCGDTTECTEHKDEDKNGKCDICEATVPLPEEDEDGELTLIEGGEAKFQFVVSSDSPSSVINAVDKFIKELKALGIETKRVEDIEKTIEDCEILIGDVKSRGEKYDLYDKKYGMKGYAIEIIDNKLIVVAGDSSGMADVLDVVKKDFFGIKKDTESLTEVKIDSSMNVEEIQDNYRITGISVDGKEIGTFKIKVDKKNRYMNAAATIFQSTIYQAKGYWLDIIDTSEEYDGNIVHFSLVENGSDNGFDIFVKDGNLVIETEFPNVAEEEINAFLSKNISTVIGKSVDFGKKFTYTATVRYVYYSEFTVRKDGKVDDFATMKACHEYANEFGHTVKADPGATYYIGDVKGQSIDVKTNVEWGNAIFNIDDKAVAVSSASRSKHIFYLTSSFTNWKTIYLAGSPQVDYIEENGLTKDDRYIGFEPGFPALIYIEDANSYAYNRYGVNGSVTPPPQKELVIVDADGTIREGTELLIDYTGCTRIEVYRIDDEPITVSGGTFITDANEAPPEYTSYARGINVQRSNATVKNITHKIIGEGDHGAPYSAFFGYKYANNVLYENLVPQGHKTYKDYFINPDGSYGAVKSNMGTYDIGGQFSNDIVFKNCHQSNFFKADGVTPWDAGSYWGIMGSNWTKNTTFDGCTLSRFDAHSGIYNLVIKDTVINNIQLIGGGTAYLENVTCYAGAGAFIYLRGDYGSTWDGDIILKDCFYRNRTPNAGIILSHWYNWSFYKTHQTTLPNLIIDNLKMLDDTGEKYLFLYSSGKIGIDMPEIEIDGKLVENINPMNISVTATIKNNTYGYEFTASNDAYIASKVTINEEE